MQPRRTRALAGVDCHTGEGNDTDRRQDNHELENRSPNNRSHQGSIDPAGFTRGFSRVAISGALPASEIVPLTSAECARQRLMPLSDKSIDLPLQPCFHFGNDVAWEAHAWRIDRLLH